MLIFAFELKTIRTMIDDDVEYLNEEIDELDAYKYGTEAMTPCKKGQWIRKDDIKKMLSDKIKWHSSKVEPECLGRYLVEFSGGERYLAHFLERKEYHPSGEEYWKCRWYTTSVPHNDFKLRPFKRWKQII